MRILPGQNRRSTGPAYGIGDQTPIESHPLSRQSIDIGRVEQMPTFAVRADGLAGQIVAKHKQNIRPTFLRGTGLSEAGGSQHGKRGKPNPSQRFQELSHSFSHPS
jgi:hypothetical protein